MAVKFADADRNLLFPSSLPEISEGVPTRFIATRWNCYIQSRSPSIVALRRPCSPCSPRSLPHPHSLLVYVILLRLSFLVAVAISPPPTSPVFLHFLQNSTHLFNDTNKGQKSPF